MSMSFKDLATHLHLNNNNYLLRSQPIWDLYLLSIVELRFQILLIRLMNSVQSRILFHLWLMVRVLKKNIGYRRSEITYLFNEVNMLVPTSLIRIWKDVWFYWLMEDRWIWGSLCGLIVSKKWLGLQSKFYKNSLSKTSIVFKGNQTFALFASRKQQDPLKWQRNLKKLEIRKVL